MFLTSAVTIRASRDALHLFERITHSLNVLLFKKKININQQLTTLPGIFLMINGDHLINGQTVFFFFLFIENKVLNDDTLWLIWCFATGSCCRVELSDLTALIKPLFFYQSIFFNLGLLATSASMWSWDRVSGLRQLPKNHVTKSLFLDPSPCKYVTYS